MPTMRFVEVVVDAEGEKPLTIKLRKWSVTKFMSLVKDVGEIAGLLGEDFRLGSESKDAGLSVPALAQALVKTGEEAIKRLTKLIVDSVSEPKLTNEMVLQWDLEDFVMVLTSLIEMNLTEKLRKNFASLKDSVQKHVATTPKAT